MLLVISSMEAKWCVFPQQLQNDERERERERERDLLAVKLKYYMVLINYYFFAVSELCSNNYVPKKRLYDPAYCWLFDFVCLCLLHEIRTDHLV